MLERSCHTRQGIPPAGAASLSLPSEFKSALTLMLTNNFPLQTHLVCTVPAFRCPSGNLSEPVNVRLLVESGGKASEAHTFLYTSAAMPATPAMQGMFSFKPHC